MLAAHASGFVPWLLFQEVARRKRLSSISQGKSVSQAEGAVVLLHEPETKPKYSMTLDDMNLL